MSRVFANLPVEILKPPGNTALSALSAPMRASRFSGGNLRFPRAAAGHETGFPLRLRQRRGNVRGVFYFKAALPRSLPRLWIAQLRATPPQLAAPASGFGAPRAAGGRKRAPLFEWGASPASKVSLPHPRHFRS
jgi:hypothetical protein